MSNGNFKVRCVKSNHDWFTTGKVYRITDGKITDDDGEKYPISACLENIDQLKVYASNTEWELVKEPETITITRHKKKVVATLTDGDREYSQYVKLSDADGDFLKDSLMVVERLCDRFIKEDTFDWESFKSGKFAVHCDTEEKAKAFLKECDAQGITWCSGEKTTRHSTKWEYYKENTKYGFYDSREQGICYGDSFAGRKIIEYSLKTTTVKEVHRPAKVGEWIKKTETGKIGEVVALSDSIRGKVYMTSDIKTSFRGDCADRPITGFVDYVTMDEYVVLENYQPEEKPDRPFLNIFSTDELLTEIKRRMKND